MKSYMLRTLLHNRGVALTAGEQIDKIPPFFRDFQRRFGCHGIFSAGINTGRVVYRVFKKLDFATFLKKGCHRTQVFRRPRSCGAQYREWLMADGRLKERLADISYGAKFT
ncbi:hypothetical protein FKG94_00790 [Exilibacterium tricleocarpae]|uniref:Uncharacterized protein n=1 Tax=Exilibacterium tricleocarpae TaxID=2591008 RepID=A0A545U9H7_9GAMM|nr:hypothetical protein [Exilibacterium tricleocarpae]TQV86125.1 hypothetical protein FKG94_00790 [Exilibacterium tricleocarpae]